MRQKLAAAFLSLLYAGTVYWRIHIHVSPPQFLWWAWFFVHEFLLGCTVWLLTVSRHPR